MALNSFSLIPPEYVVQERVHPGFCTEVGISFRYEVPVFNQLQWVLNMFAIIGGLSFHGSNGVDDVTNKNVIGRVIKTKRATRAARTLK